MNKAIEYDPAQPIYYLNRGNIYHEMKNFESAHWNFDIAIEIEDKNPWYWHAKGLSFQHAAQDKEGVDLAIKCF